MNLEDILSKLKFDDDDAPVKKFGSCSEPECKELRIPYQWCKPCSAKHFKANFSEWTSGRKELDNIIKKSQLSASGPTSFLEWIDFKDFCGFNYLCEVYGGRSIKTYSAIWTNGYIQNWNIDKKSWERIRNTRIILHYIPKFEILLQKVKDLKYNNLRLFRKPYGISKDSTTHEWIIVLKYEIGAENLNSYLKNTYYRLNWLKKLDILIDITDCISEIHKADLIHKDLNPNFILVTSDENKNKTYVYSSKMFSSIEIGPSEKGIYGIVPYIAPEVLRGGESTKASDIYSFGIIMSIFVTGQLPYCNVIDEDNIDSDKNLILITDICKGLRPEIEIEYLPDCYQKLMEKCWDQDPLKRPPAHEIAELISNWWQSLIREQNTRTTIEFKIGDEVILKKRKNETKFENGNAFEGLISDVNVNAHLWLQFSISSGLTKFIPSDELVNQNPFDKGNFGSVSKAIWTKSKNDVVLKRLTNTKDIKNKKLEAFIHELQMHIRLDLSNRIIRCLGISQDEVDKEYLLVMEYANCGDLCSYLKKNKDKLSWNDKKGLSFQIAEGIAYLHTANILHRDLHPKNIVVHDDNAKITDFGMSKIEAHNTSIHPGVFGIMFYMEPRRIKDKTFEYKKYSDIYSFGVLMWEISSCRRPFDECIHSVDEGLLSMELINGKRETPVPDTPLEYENLYKQCWDKDVEKRPTIQQVLDEFSKMRSGKHEDTDQSSNNQLEINNADPNYRPLIINWKEAYDSTSSTNSNSSTQYDDNDDMGDLYLDSKSIDEDGHA